MSCKRKNRTRQRKRSPCFQFLDLPPDLQLHVLSFIDLHTLQSAVSSGPHLRTLYETYTETLLRTATQHHGQQIQNLMLTTLSIALCIHSIDVYHRPDHDDLEEYFAETLDVKTPGRLLPADSDAVHVLNAVCKLDAEVYSLVYDYALDAYGRVYRFDNPGVVIPPLILSSTEHHRIARAFWRLKLFGVLFYNYVDRFDMVLSHGYPIFFDRLSAFEIDEMVTVYQYMVRYRHHFISAFPHEDCPFTGKPVQRNRDPFECPHCQGRHRTSSANASSMQRIQAFWQFFENRYLIDILSIGSDRMWVEPDQTRGEPIKLWRDILETNKPNVGWKQWRRSCDFVGWRRMSRDHFISRYRNRGFCFWDKERLKNWDFLRE